MFYLPRLVYEAGWGAHVVIMQKTKIGIVEMCNNIICIFLYSQFWWMSWQCMENCYSKGCVFKYNSEHFWLWLALIRVQKQNMTCMHLKKCWFKCNYNCNELVCIYCTVCIALTWTDLDRTFWACRYGQCKFYHPAFSGLFYFIIPRVCGFNNALLSGSWYIKFLEIFVLDGLSTPPIMSSLCVFSRSLIKTKDDSCPAVGPAVGRGWPCELLSSESEFELLSEPKT